MSKASPDFTYHISACGTVYTLYPENTQAEHNWRILEQEFPNGKIPFFFWRSIRAQLRKAGFSIQKAKPVTKRELDAIFSEMEALGIC